MLASFQASSSARAHSPKSTTAAFDHDIVPTFRGTPNVEDEELAHAVTDLLDLRYAHEVLFARSMDLSDLAQESRTRGRTATEAPLLGWAWALMTDGRQEAQTMAMYLMSER